MTLGDFDEPHVKIRQSSAEGRDFSTAVPNLFLVLYAFKKLFKTKLYGNNLFIAYLPNGSVQDSFALPLLERERNEILRLSISISRKSVLFV